MTALELQSAFVRLLAWGALPLWLAAGFADWLCHRRSVIQHTSGLPESLLHLVLFVLIAAPIVLALYFEVNAALLSIAALGAVTHTLVSWWDTLYSAPRRYIGPVEQIVHSYLEMLPLFAAAVLIVVFGDALRAPEWALVRRAIPLPRGGVSLTLGAMALGLAFIVEEAIRCWGARAAGAVRAHSSP